MWDYLARIKLILGINKNPPTATASMALSKTIAADKSLAILASRRISGLTRSTSLSKTVFRSSRVITKDIVRARINHSSEERLRSMPRMMAKVARKMCILKFGSDWNADLIPWKANPKLS